jgi:hypothetical protein
MFNKESLNMTVKIYGNKITNCGTGISTPKDADVEIGTNHITDCGVAIELRDPLSFIESIGLSPDTPVEKVLVVLEAISNGKNRESDIVDEVKKSGLLDYLSGAANITSLVSAFYQLSNSSLVQQAIALLLK